MARTLILSLLHPLALVGLRVRVRSCLSAGTPPARGVIAHHRSWRVSHQVALTACDRMLQHLERSAMTTTTPTGYQFAASLRFLTC